MTRNHLNLRVGDRIRVGKKYAKKVGYFNAGEIITLVEGYFEYENGLYCEIQTAPSIWDEKSKEYDSIYHLFGNDLEDFMDCEVLMPNEPNDKRSVASKADSSTGAGPKI